MMSLDLLNPPWRSCGVNFIMWRLWRSSCFHEQSYYFLSSPSKFSPRNLLSRLPWMLSVPPASPSVLQLLLLLKRWTPPTTNSWCMQRSTLLTPSLACWKTWCEPGSPAPTPTCGASDADEITCWTMLCDPSPSTNSFIEECHKIMSHLQTYILHWNQYLP